MINIIFIFCKGYGLIRITLEASLFMDFNTCLASCNVLIFNGCILEM